MAALGDVVAVALDGHYYILIPMEFHQVRPHSINNSSSPLLPILCIRSSASSHLNYCHGALWYTDLLRRRLLLMMVRFCRTGKTNKNIVVVGTLPNDNVSVRISLLVDGIARQLN